MRTTDFASVHRRPAAGSAAVAVLLLALAGCDSSAAELVQEIDAAREGCTEEMLEAGDEVCVQMFERYIDMGTEAIDTYIGAMRAFDEALQRRPGIQFDTTGFGHAISPGFGRGATGSEPEAGVNPPEGIVERWEPAGPSWESEGSPDPEPGPYRSYEPVQPSDESGEVQPASPSDWSTRPSAGAAASPSTAPPPPRRGAILPPSERLRRPWIGDEADAGRYTPDDADPGAPGTPRGVRRAAPRPEADPDPGPRGTPY